MDFSRRGRQKGKRDSGQSTVEYLIVTFLLVSVLVYPTSIYETISTTLKNKYLSYCFGVAISDPPRKEFDDKLEKGAEIAEKTIKTIQDIEKAAEGMKDFKLPVDKLPSFNDIDIEKIVKKELP